MNNDLGVWTYQDCALVLIDYQKEIFETIRSETSADLVELNVRLLARTAKAFNMPIVLSTVGVAAGINGPTQPADLRWTPHRDLPHVRGRRGTESWVRDDVCHRCRWWEIPNGAPHSDR